MVQNAVKFNKKNGVINIRLQIERSLFAEDQYNFKTIIMNTGPQIDEDKIHTLFEPFGELR